VELRLHGPTEVEAALVHEPELELVGDAGGEGFGPLQMFAASLALCTASVLHGYAHEVAKVGIEGLSIRVRWSYDARPNRVGRIEMVVRWPELPEERLEPARRAAASCTVHHTLEHPPELVTRIAR
jgi:uncharacterized OsmC-like protein